VHICCTQQGELKNELLELICKKIYLKKENTYSNRVPSMLITSSNISSQVPSTTPTAFIALLQLLGCKKEDQISLKEPPSIVKPCHLHKAKERNDSIQGNQLPKVLQKCEVLSTFIKISHK
jgi:hypothetical protein